ncbi:MAG: signal peptidase I [Elusimicrobia bacterium]|nr:signal peptidase I [Elusimicrobiota bacterium]
MERWTREAIEWSDTAISAILLSFLIMAFILQAFKIPSGSMQPTLQIGDHLFVNKFIYGSQLPFTQKKLWNFKEVKRFDVIVFLCPPQALSEEERKENLKKDFIKRAIGLPGDTVQIKDKVLIINGEKVSDTRAHFFLPTIYPRPNLWRTQEDYQKSWEKGDFVYLPVEAVRDNFGPVRVPAGHIFVMGDNRDGSFDSRFWGPLPEKYLKGKAWLVYWPFSRMQMIR